MVAQPPLVVGAALELQRLVALPVVVVVRHFRLGVLVVLQPPGSPSDVVVGETRAEAGLEIEVVDRRLEQIECKHEFKPHPGWRGHIEREMR